MEYFLTRSSFTTYKAAYQNAGSRILLFSGGAATEGPGMIVTNQLKEAIRSHHDLEKDTAKYWKKAQKVFSLLLFVISN